MVDRVKTTMTWRRQDYEALKEARVELSRYLDTVIDYYKAFEMEKWDLNEGVFIKERKRVLVGPVKMAEFLTQYLSPSQQREAGRKLGQMVRAEARYQGKDVKSWAEYAFRMAGAGRITFKNDRIAYANPPFTEHIIAGVLEELLDADVEIGDGAENVYVFKFKQRS